MTTKPERIAKDDLEKFVITNIAECGWHCVNVIEDDDHPPWSYTIGFWETWNFPELVIIGRSRATAHYLLNSIATGLDADRHPDLNVPTGTLIPSAKCFFIEVSSQHYQDYVGFARWFYRGKPFPLHQIVWPNADRFYPWDNNAPKSFKEWQPLLGQRAQNEGETA